MSDAKMSDEKITIGIEVDHISVDRDNLVKEVEQIESDLGQNAGLFENMVPEVSNLFNPLVRSLRAGVDDVSKKLNEAMSGEKIGEDIVSGLNASVGAITASLANVKAAAGAVGQAFKAIPAGMEADFSKSINDMIRTAQSALSKTYGMGGASRSVSGYATTLKNDKVFGAAFDKTMQKYGLNETQSTELLNGIVRKVVPAMRNADISDSAIAASRGAMKRADFIPTITSFKERLPARYRDLPLDLTQTTHIPKKKASMYEGNLTHEEYNKVKMVAENNEVFERALQRAGVARRGTAMDGNIKKAGVLQMPKEPISRRQYAEALGYLYSEELIPSLEGAPAYYHPITSHKAIDTRAIASKNSSVPAAVYSATAQLDTIDVDPLLMPKGSKADIDAEAFKKGTVALTANAARVRPNMYQIMSLSYDDFASGKVIDSKGETQSQFDDTATGRSVNKIIYQSGFTDLIGMHGNLSNGEGGKLNTSSPIMLQVDMSDRIRKKDSAGNLVFENGMPVMDDEGRALISNMFKKTKQMTYMRNGKEETYNYAAVPYGKDGKNYVPTNVKDGKIIMVREEDYLAASRPWLEQLGVNVFDAFEGEDAEYADLSKFSKAFDVRNRNTTPSVPFEQIGGKMPASSKIGFIDASVVKGLMKQNEDDANKDKKYALDGAFFAMPGYIPGGAGVVRAPGIKGAGVSVEFKQMIRDIYGDVDEFLLPGINAPQEIKDEYAQNGLEGVRKKFSSEDVSKYFVDAMQMEMLMTDSVLKSSIYTSGKTQQEMQKTFDTIMTLSGGMRIHKTANDFWSTQNSLSAQVSEKLDLSPEELQENADKWTGYINRLEHDPMFAVSELFSGENDPLSARVRKNPALLNQDPEAQLRLQNAIDNAKNSMLYNEMFAKGDAAMGLALPNPGEFFTRAAQMNGMSIVDTTRYGKLTLGDSKIAVPRLYDSVKLGGLRYPNNQGEQQSLENDREYIKLMDRYGLNRDAVYMNSKTIGKMGGGDFDGDTVQLIQGKLARIIERTYANRGDLMEKQKREREDLEKEPEAWNRKATSDDIADFLYRQSTASFQMGAVSNANEALSQVDWSNPEHVARYAPGAKDLEIMYDIDSTFQKKGTLADWTAEAKEARKLGRPFATLFKGLQGIADNPTPESFKRLGDFSKVNFASKYNGLTASMMTALASNPLSSGAVDMMIEAQSDLQGIPALKASGVEYKQKQAEFLELNNRVVAEELTRGAIPSTETIEKMKSALAAWGDALGSKEDGFAGWQTRKPEAMDDEQKAAVDAFRKQQGRIRFLENLGLNQRSVEGKEGYAAVGFYKDNRLDTDISSFQSAFDEQKDAQRAKLAITLGANKDSLEATKAAGERAAAITAAKKRLSEMVFSYSSLNSFVETPERWHETYVAHPKENRPEYRTPETMLGSLTHKVQEIWVNDRLAAGGIGGARTADEYETIFRELLSGGDANTLKTKYGLTDKELGEFAQLRDEIGYDPQTGKYNQKKIKGDFAKRFQNSVDYVRELPHMLKDWKIEGAEVVTSPDFGEGGKSNYGKIDLLARDPKTGKLVAFDTKASQTGQQIDKAKEQVMLYNARGGKFVPETVTNGIRTAAHFEYGPDKANEARPFERGGVISYNIPATGNPEDRIKMFDIDERDNADIEKEFQERKAQVIRYAERGFNAKEIENHTYRMSSPGMSPADGVQQTVSTQPVPATSAPQQMKVEIDPHSGRAVAQEITLQQGIDSYLEKMTGTQSQLLSMGRRKENPLVPNQWLNYDFMLNAGYHKQMDKLNAMGLAADDPRRTELVRARDDAKAEFDRTLAISSLKDIESANEMLQEHFSKGEVDSSAAGFAKEYDSLTESVAKATQALELYKQQTEEIEAINIANKAKRNGVEATLKTLNKDAEGYEKQLAELLDKIEAAEAGSDEQKKLNAKYKEVETTAQKNVENIEKNENEKDDLTRKIDTAEADLVVRKENIQKADAANDDLNKTLDEKKAYISKKAETYFEKQLRDLQVKTTGESLTPEEIAAGKKDELINRIESIKKGLAENVKKGVLTQDTAKNLLNSIDAIDADAYGTKIQEGEQFKKEQEQASYQYKQQEIARKREDEILTARERNEARMEGKPVDERKHEERAYEARIAELEEQRRRLEDTAMNDSADVESRTRAMNEAIAQEEYIEKVKAAHDETLRTDAFADIRDFNEKLSEENKTQGADSIATGYIKQFDALGDAIESATEKYEELKKKVESKDHTQEDVDALNKVKTQMKELGKSAKTKRDHLQEQFTESSDRKISDLQHLASGKEYTPAEIATLRKSSLQKQIEEFVQGQNLVANNMKLPKSMRDAAEARAKEASAIDLEKYEQTVLEQEEFEKEQREQQEKARIKRVYRQADKHARDPYGVRSNTFWGRADEMKQGALDQYENDAEQLKTIIAKQKTKLSHTAEGTEEYEELSASLKEAEERLKAVQTAAAGLEGPMGTAATAASMLAQSAQNVAIRFGKQMFQKALQEAKQFVVQWDATMTEIRMVTGKTQEEASSLSAELMQTAIDMKVSPTDVGSAAVDLYRQGLSDEDVSVRMEDVLKFSKVAGITVEQASKMLTTAVSNDLVSSTQEAMDAMVALGDSASTTAEDISKGMQKSAAAAKEAGVSYEQLLTMLTIITSKTQLGGANAGTTLQTLFNRMYRVTSGQDIYDENGNRIAATTTSNALKSVGVNLFDSNGNYRGAYDVLMDLAKGWEGYSDTDRNLILNTLGAGRQSSNVATLLQGLGEDDGELADKYMSLASGSDGVTDEKYVAYLESLDAALQNVKTSFDAFIESLSITGIATGFLNFIANIIQGLTSASNATSGFTKVLRVLIPAIAAVGVAIASATGKLTIAGAALNINPIFAAITTFTLLATAIDDIVSALSSADQKEDPFETLTNRYGEIGDKKTESLNSIDRIEQLAKKENRTTAETNELNEELAKLNTTLGRTGSGANDAAFGIDDFKDSCDEAVDSVNKLAEAEALFTAKGLVADVVSGAEGKVQPEVTQDTDLWGTEVLGKTQKMLERWAVGYSKNGDGTFATNLFGRLISVAGVPRSSISGEVDKFISDSFADYILSTEEGKNFLRMYKLDNLVLDAESFKKFIYLDEDLTNDYRTGAYGTVALEMDTSGTISQIVGNNEDWVINAAQDTFLQMLPVWYSEYLNDNQGRSQNLDTLQQEAFDYIYGLVKNDSDLSAADALLFSSLYSENMIKQYGEIPELSDILSQYGLDIQLFLQHIEDGDGGFNTNFIQGYIAQNRKDYIVDLRNGAQDTGLSYEQAVANAVSDQGAALVTGYSYDGKTFYADEHAAAEAMAASYGEGYYNTWVTKSGLKDDSTKQNWGLFVASLQNSGAIQSAEVYSYNGQLYTQDELGQVLEKEGVIHRASDDEAEYEDSETGRSEKAFKAITSSKTSYQTTNSSKFEADALYEAIVSNGISSWQDLFDAIAANELPTLENVVNSNPGTVGAILSNFVDFDSETGALTVKNGATDADLLMLFSQIASASESYTAAGTMGDLSSGKQTKGTWDRFKSGSALTDLSTDNLKKVVGDDVFAELQQIDNAAQAPTVEELITENPELTEETAQEEVKQLKDKKEAEKIQTLEAGGYTKYVDMITRNAAYGIDGLTTLQQNELQQDLFGRILSGDVSGLSESMRSEYAGSDTNLSTLADVAYNLEQSGLSVADLSPEAEGYEEAKRIIEEMGYSVEDVQDKIKSLNKTLASEGVRAAKKYGDQTEDVADAMDEWGTTTESVMRKQKSLRSAASTAMNNQYYRDAFAKGDRSTEVLDQISEMTGYDSADLKSGKFGSEVLDFLDALEAEDMQSIANEVDALFEKLAADQKISLGDIGAEGADISQLIDALVNIEGAVSDNVQAYLEYLQAQGFEGHFETTDTGMHFVIDKMPGKKSGGGGGGGGGSKKSEATKLIEEQDRETKLREHIIKMIQYEETRYQNADELTNYGIMLQHEIDEEERQTKVIEQNIEALKSQMAQTSKGSDDWYSLREAILKAEESLAEMNNTIEENKKKLKENEQAILKLHTELEQEVKGEIETRISEEKDMLDGQVNMEQTILDAIKNRYEEEWELMQKDIDKKKKALQEEIDLIDERLQRRKDAEDEAEKYEELAEYKRQLALISTDSTRTKDQAALKEKIADLEKELAWDKAEEEADLQKDGLQDQIDAYDEYVDDYQEYLDDLLENANNFADEVNSVMQMSHEDMIAWLQKNVEEYTNSLESSQKQMTQGWDDTFKQMKGIIDTFWEEIAQKLSSKESFLEYMKQSSSYQNASEDEKKQMEYNWETMYDSWISAKKVSQEAVDYSHTDETLDGTGATDSGSSSGKYGVSVSANGKMFNSGKIYATKTAALNAGRSWVDRVYASAYVGLDDVKNAQQIASIDASVTAAKNRIYVYKHGGMVDYTGPAWVDGTKSRPEAFLSAEDTQMIRTLIDGWKYVATRPTITSIDGLLKDGSSGNTIGDVYVTLNEAQFNTDDDYELVAQKVGEAFTRELAKNGFKTASFAF